MNERRQHTRGEPSRHVFSDALCSLSEHDFVATWQPAALRSARRARWAGRVFRHEIASIHSAYSASPPSLRIPAPRPGKTAGKSA